MLYKLMSVNNPMIDPTEKMAASKISVFLISAIMDANWSGVILMPNNSPKPTASVPAGFGTWF